MKNIFFAFLLSTAAVEAFGSEIVSCHVETPCSWLEPIPGVFEKSLGYCVENISGDRNTLIVKRVDQNGKALKPISLKVIEMNNQAIAASNKVGNITLNVSQYGDFLAGGLLVKTESAPDGLGFFISCRFKPRQLP